MLKRNEKVYYYLPEIDNPPYHEDELEIYLDENSFGAFTSPISSKRSFSVTEPGYATWTSYISAHSKVVLEFGYGGLPSLILNENGEEDDIFSAFEFFFFEGQIYTLQCLEGLKLMKVNSENVEEDWKWLQSILA